MAVEQFNILVNAGIAGIFAVFALLLFDRFTKFLDKVLEAERITRLEAMKQIADELKAVATITAATQALMAVHDQRVASALPDMVKEVRKRADTDRR